MPLRVLVFGSTGQLARELARAGWPAGTAPTFLDRTAADLSAPETLGAIVRARKPDVVIVAAAYTAVDRAESEEPLAALVNGVAPAEIARAAAALSVPVIHFSTDYVFDGTKAAPYEESDPVAPVGAYGRSKLAGEEGVRAGNPKHLILRTSWVYSAFGTNFLRTMLRLASARDEVGVVADQRGCPTAAHDLARAVAEIAPRFADGNAEWGTYHLAGGTATTWHGFAEAIFAELKRRGLKRPLNKPIATADYPTPAKRPMNSRLSCELFASRFGVRLPGFESAAPRVLDEALAHG